MTRWKELSLVLLLCLCLFSSGCSPPAPEPEPESQPESSSAVSETSSQEEEPVSSQREYLPKHDDYISAFDFETIYTLCCDALTEFQSALVTAYETGNETKVDFSKYIENPDLIAYMEKQLELGLRFQGLYPYREFDELGLVEYSYWSKNGIYLRIAYEDMGTIEFIVHRADERFVILEWFNDTKDSMDTLLRGGHLRDIKDGPLYWDDYDPEELKKAIEEMPNKFPYGPPDPVK